MDNRLDFISEFKNHDEAISQMTICRRQFMLLDDQLKGLMDHGSDNPAMLRSISNSRTRLEEALQHAIKALCLMHEVKK